MTTMLVCCIVWLAEPVDTVGLKPRRPISSLFPEKLAIGWTKISDLLLLGDKSRTSYAF